ncbi:MAG: class I SAM-dependent methyltransferase [Deltaproteobacteria bacterium]|nr:class I SAM-dependent methyltransferase [Deltaproteobacteria bacterium]
MPEATPRHRWYDGLLYAWFYDPVEAEKRRLIAEWIPPGSTVLDLCAGTGALAMELAQKCSRVVGMDISPRMLAWARARNEKAGHSNVTFLHGDSTRAGRFVEGPFDFAVASLLMHEIREEERALVLSEACKVARRVILADFTAPPPSNLRGIMNHWMELFFGGPANFRVYSHYLEHGGLPGLLERLGLPVLDLARDRHGACTFVMTAAPQTV